MRNWKYLVTGLSCAALMAVTPVAQMNVPGMSIVAQAAAEGTETAEVKTTIDSCTYETVPAKAASYTITLDISADLTNNDLAKTPVETADNWKIKNGATEKEGMVSGVRLESNCIVVTLNGGLDSGDMLVPNATNLGLVLNNQSVSENDGTLDTNQAMTGSFANITKCKYDKTEATPAHGKITLGLSGDTLTDAQKSKITSATCTLDGKDGAIAAGVEYPDNSIAIVLDSELTQAATLTLNKEVSEFLGFKDSAESIKSTGTPEITVKFGKATTGDIETSDSALSEDSFKFDFKHQRMTIGTENNTKIYVSFPKVNKNNEYKEAKATSYDVVNDMVTVDLSSQKVDKGFYVEVKGNYDTKPVVYHFAATEKVKAGKWDGANGTVDIQDKTKNNVKDCIIEYCTQNGDWDAYATYDEKGEKSYEKDLSMYEENGATLRMRVRATISVASSKKGTTLKKKVGKDTKDMDTYDVGGIFASNEVKVKVGKRPAGPKVKVDYKKQTFTLPKAGKFKIYQGAAVVDGGKDGKDAAAKTEIPMKEYIKNAGSIDAWLVSDGKKARSAYTAVEFNAVDVLKVANEQNTGDISGAVVSISGEEDKSKVVKAKVDEVKRGDEVTGYNVTLENKTGKACEVIVGSSPSADAKATSLKDGKTITIKNKKADEKVFIRIAADAKNQVWASEYAVMGSVKKVVESTPTTAPAETPES